MTAETGPWSDPVHLETLLAHLQEGVFLIVDGRVRYANEPFARLCGYDRDAIVGAPFAPLIAPEDREMVLSRYAARVAGRAVPGEYEFRLLRGDSGERVWVAMSVGTVSEAGEPTVVGTLRDVTELKKTRSLLDASEADIRSILDNLPDVFYRVGMDGLITAITPSCAAAIGYTPQEMIGTPMADYYVHPAEREKVVAAIAEGNGAARQVEHPMRHKSGATLWVSTNAYLRRDDAGNPLCVEGISRDITERKKMELKLEWYASTDVLTGLPNRRAFMERLEQEIRRSLRYGHPLTMLAVDLDHFKKVNDTYGHQGGDRALVHFADLAREVVRGTDVIGRLGGEEFALLLPETGEGAGAELAERLRERVARTPLPFGGRAIGLTVSVGVAALRKEVGSVDHLLADADKALYGAKRGGRDRIAVATG